MEDFYHPEKYKTKYCQMYPDNLDECEFGDLCAFAHHEDELSIPIFEHMEKDGDFFLFYFKTIWCPKSHIPHNRECCNYAHNWQDFRRAPHHYGYAPIQCHNWEANKSMKTYRDGCPLDYRCGNCHGWKEISFHPTNYKTQ